MKIIKYLKNPFVIWTLAFLFFSLLTILIFNHRLTNIFTEYGMPDIDTDGGLWYQWFTFFTKERGILQYNPDIWGYPFGFDFTYFPFFNLVYFTQILILQHIIGFSWQNLIFITNLSSLATYPLSAMSATWLSYYLTKNRWASILTGLIFSFSYYHVHMARGQMSINHIELIPIYFLSLFYFIHKTNAFSLILSSLAFAFLFMTDAYYAFFSGILSVPIILFYPTLSLFNKIKQTIIYYLTLFLIFVSINLNYFITNFYLFNQSDAIATGRASIPKNELLSVLFYFTPQEGSLLYDKMHFFGLIIFIIIPAIAISGLILLRKNKLYVTLFICLLIAILISTYIPIFYPLNELYFQYFGIFRGVARMILPAYLFIGLLVGIAISEFVKTHFLKIYNKKYVPLLFFFLYSIAILSGLTLDETFYRRGDMAHTASLYEPIKNNKDIRVIAPYPMRQGDVGSRCPQTFHLLGQIIHQKIFACGASPFDPLAQEHYEKITYFDKNTVSYLSVKNIDTIFVYKNIEKNEKEINKMLRNDPRIKYIGRYRKEPRSESLWFHNGSWDFNVYQIKEVVERNKFPKSIFYTLNKNVKVEYKKIAPEKYVLSIKNLSSTSDLIFNSSYSEKWNLYLGDFTNTYSVLFNLKNNHHYDNQKRHKDYMNKWILDPAEIKNKYPDSYSTNPDGSINIKATVFFAPQATYSLGNIISWTSFIFLSAFLIMYKLYERYKR